MRTFAFRPPIWRSPEQTNLRTSALLVSTVCWVGLYSWLSRRLWNTDLALGDRGTQLLILACILVGVGVALGWNAVWPQWKRRLRTRSGTAYWPALSLEKTLQLTPSEFEAYVAHRLFARQGYRIHNTPDVKDGGIDILVTDHYGQDAVVQCKRYSGTVGESTVRDLYGTMIHAGATHAFLVTSGRISEEARRWATDKPITLIDGERLVELAHSEPL